MLRTWLVILGVLLSCDTLKGDEAAAKLCEPWQSDYVGDDAAGKHVLALWKFDQETIEDASGRGHSGVLHGAKINPQGRFGAVPRIVRRLASGRQAPPGAVENHADLNPKGPFTLELWMRPKPELNAEYPDAFLLDKKYVADNGYQLILGPPDAAEARTLRATLGFGGTSATWRAKPAQFQPGT